MVEIFVIEDDPVMGRLLEAALRQAGLEPVLFTSGAAALEALGARDVGAVCLDVVLPDASGEAILIQLRASNPDLPVIMLSAQASIERAVEIMKLRPFDYFVKPFSPERLIRSVEAALRQHELTRRLLRLEREVQEGSRFDEIVGRSPRMQHVYAQIEKVLDNRVGVFIQGESGTGKELVAKAVHYNGQRRQGPLVTLNCGAIAESLQESELFGHERGSFTGAVGLYRGKFEQAHRGTIFLDEVGELSQAAQTRLLRVLQEGTIQRLGGTQTIPVDVRVISATHRDLDAWVADGRFRQDLYYRLMVFPIEMPPLHERLEDIPLLVSHFVRKHQKQIGGEPATFDRDALDVMCRYDWPGNVRELENVVVRMLVSSGGGEIGVNALPPPLVLRSMGLDTKMPVAGAAVGAPDDIVPLKELERQAISQALVALEGNVSLVAKRLGLGRATLYRKLAQYGLGSLN
ncbi:MAG: sigma-54 dependent transcriptional regulator [Acidobacteriota bacterium]